MKKLNLKQFLKRTAAAGKNSSGRSVLLSILLAGLLAVQPAHFFLTFSTGGEYLSGLRVDYLIPRLYLTDIFLIAMLLTSTSLISFIKRITVKVLTLPRRSSSILNLKFNLFSILSVLVIALSIAVLIRQWFTPIPVLGITVILRIFLTVIVSGIVWRDRQKLNRKVLLLGLLIGMGFQIGLAWYQIIEQQHLVGYSLLGEPALRNPLGLAKVVWGGREFTAPYGTSAHPNILSAWIAWCVLILLSYRNGINQASWPVAAVAAILALMGIAVIIFSQSIAAIFVLLIGATLFSLPKNGKKYVAVLLVLVGALLCLPRTYSILSQVWPDTSSLSRRKELLEGAVSMFTHNSIVGIGAGQFTYALEMYGTSNETVRFIQPVHSLVWLWLAENGILGLMLIACAIMFSRQSLTNTKIFTKMLLLLALFIPAAVWDHYLLSFPAGQLVLALTPALLSHRVDD